jgi:type IX secretion system PorP/SprF family membrane protein
MKKLYLIVLFICMGFTGELLAQDPQFTQFYAAPLYLNPGFTGTARMHRANLVYRNQWPSLPKAFTTTALSYDYNMRRLRSGFGGMIVQDRAGTGGYTRTSLTGSYSYKVNFKNGWVMSPGLQFGYVLTGLDWSKLTLGDQIGFRGQLPESTNDPAALNINNFGFFDFGTGMLVYNKTTWLGASVYHLNEPNQSLLGTDDRLSAKYTVHGGMRINTYNGVMTKDRTSSLAPAFIYKKQGKFQQLDLGLQFHYDPIMAGLWYRGLPLFKDDYGHYRQDALAFLFGFRFPQFDLGYSYDFTVSSFGPVSGGAHEVTMVMNFVSSESRKVKRKEKFIPCPTFR